MSVEVIIVEGAFAAKHWYDCPKWIVRLIRVAFVVDCWKRRILKRIDES